LIVAAALGCLPLHTEYATPWTWSQCARSIAREDEAVPDESGHGRPRQPHSPTARSHATRIATLDGRTLPTKRQDFLCSAAIVRKSSSPAIPRTSHDARRARNPLSGWGALEAAADNAKQESGPPFGHTAEHAQPDRAAHVCITRRLWRLPSGPPHRVAPVTVWSGGDRSCSRRSLLRPPPLFSRSPSLRRTPCRSGRKEGLLHPSGGHTVGYCACTV
jgi:hypothetical protein